MIKINLKPVREERRKENVRRQVTLFLLSLALVTVTAVYFHIILGSKIEQVTTDLEETNAELAELKKRTDEIAAIKAEIKELDTKLGVINSLNADREAAVRLLDAMTNVIIPQRMMFTNLEERNTKVTEETSKKSITIKGVAMDEKTISDFMTNLEASALFENVEFITAQQERATGGRNVRSFHFTCDRAQAEDGTEAKTK